jgi:hypothetical protein
MAYYFLFPEIDTTIYSHPNRKKLNTGRDEILELVKEKHTDQKYYPSRILIKFKNEEIKSLISDTIGSSTFNSNALVNLNLFSTQQKNLTTILNIEAYAVSQSWHEGKGRYSNIPTSSDGTNWIYRDNSTLQTTWPTGSQAIGNTYGSRSFTIGELPSGSEYQITINDFEIVPVISSSLFNSSVTETYCDISTSIDAFGENLRDIINDSSSFTLVSASYDVDTNKLVLSGSSIGTIGNVTVVTSSIRTRPTEDGNIYQNWIKPTVANHTMSLEGGTDIIGSDLYPGTTGSISSSVLTAGGGSWWTGSEAWGQTTQQFLNAENLDIDLDVTKICQRWSSSLFASQTYNQGNLPSGVENNGFIIKQPDIIEASISHSFGEMQYFSVDTHTIFPPKLTFKWDDSTHTYQSSAKNNGELNLTLYRNKKEYNQNDIALFRINVRDKYPTRNFVTSSNYLNTGYLTTGSYYSIRDAHTEEEIIPFDDNYTKMSADSEGMYFKVYMKGLQPERYYRILFKHINNDGTTIYDDNYVFKVIR